MRAFQALKDVIFVADRFPVDGWHHSKSRARRSVMRRKRLTGIGAALMAVAFILFVLPPASIAQQKPIELKYATIYPPTHPFSIADQHWIQKVEKETNGRVRITPYWSGSLVSAREGYQDAIGGVADIVYASIAYEKAGFDLSKGQGGFYQGMMDQETKLRIFWQLWDKYPEIRKEFANVRVLGLFTAPNMYLMTTKPVKNLADLKGMRIKAPIELVQPLKALGAEALIMPMTEVYESVNKGILTGLWGSHELYKSMKFVDVVKYETDLVSIVGPIPARIMPDSSWKKLPSDVQKVLEGNKEWWSLECVKEVSMVDTEGLEMAKKAGIQFGQLPPSDVQKFHELYNAELAKSAKALDDKGLPGTKFYQDVRRLIEQATVKK
jgi:TRAP-type C4-dicarboxylate transport system substrate-binding protein